MLDAPSTATPEKASASPHTGKAGGASRRGSHQLASTQTCKRLYALRYVFEIIGKEDKPYRMAGTLVHLCLAYHYAEQLAVRPDWLSTPLDAALEIEGAGCPNEIKLAKDIYAYYKANVAAGDTLKPVYVEQQFEATIGQIDPGGPDPELDSESISIRPDLVAELNGELWIVDHKTQRGGWNSDRLGVWKDDGEFLMSWQAMLYLHVLRALETRPVKGFLIQRVKRNPPYDHDRNPLRIPALAYKQVPRAARDMVREELKIRRELRQGTAPTPNFAACQGRYGPCDYRDLCSADSEVMKALAMSTSYVQIGGMTSDQQGASG